MNYSTFMRITTKTGRIQLEDASELARTLHTKAQRASSDEELDDGEYNESAELFEKLFNLADSILNADSFVGSASDFHNLAVEYARANAEDYACSILEKGISAFGDSIDLLADYLEYGSKSGRLSRCNEIYEVLCKIPKEGWNWRAFQFSINYLQVKLDLNKSTNNTINEMKAEIEELANAFEKYLPDEENAYLSKATLAQEFGDPNKELTISILEDATAKGVKLARSPKCNLRLASIRFERGEFDEALELLEKTKLDNIEVQPGVNRAYVFVLSALCKMAKYYSERKNDAIEIGSFDERIILSVYKDFEVAQGHSRYEKFVDDIEKLVVELETITEVANPYR